jgi:opacity protein-like surface antigen
MTHSSRQILWSVAMLTTALAAATPAAAQSRPHRVEISANVGALTGTSTLKESRSFSSHGNETATLTTDHRTKTAVPVSVGGAVRIVRHLWIGVQYAMADMKPSASISAVIPHPLLFNAPRTVEGSIDNVAHNERNAHVDLMYALSFAAVDVKVMGGPTLFNMKQDFVSDVALTETYPFDAATFASATKKQVSNSGIGFNAGVDISYPLSSNVGVGTLIRYSRADVKFNDSDIGQQTVRAGGIEAGAGVRIRF